MSAVIKEIPKSEITRVLRLSGHIGFDSLPDQMVTKSMENGFVFNILCIGETGAGKSTLMDSLFNTNFESTPSPHNLDGVKLKANTYDLQESNVKLRLTICHTVGYGDQINKDNSFQDITNYIDEQFENYLQEELKIKRSLHAYQDTRIHVCLYFICPTGHGLKAIDLVCMKQLHQKVNIFPIIAKADTMSKQELDNFKIKVMKEFVNYGIEIYKFPTDDESVTDVNSQMNTQLPFAVVGSTDFSLIGNRMMRCREYPWGIVEVENEYHSDFVKLREMLIRTNMEDMRDKTHNHFYEIYRKKRLEELGFVDLNDNDNSIGFLEICEIRRNTIMENFRKREDNMRKSFITRVQDTEAELKQAEKDLYEKYEELSKDYMSERNKLEESMRQLEDDIHDYNKIKKQSAAVNYQSYYSLTLGRNKRK